MKSGPNLLVAWEPRWQGFVSSIEPALARSKPRLAAECASGIRPGRTTVASFLFHAAMVMAVVSVYTSGFGLAAYEHVDPYENFEPSEYHVIYYRGQPLPQMKDAGGAQAGVSGRSGGRELFNRVQTIRIARGNKLLDTIVDAPSLSLPRTDQAVANVLSMPAGPASAPPLSALQKLTGTPNLSAAVTPVEASPSVIHERLNAPEMKASVAEPAPGAVHDKLSAPVLAHAVVEPAQQAPLRSAGMRLPDTGAVQPIPAPVSAAPRDIGHMPRMPLSPVAEAAPDASLPIGARNSSGPAIASIETVDVAPPPPDARGAGGGGGGNGAGVIGSALKALNSVISSIGAPSNGGGSGNGGGGSGNSQGGGGVGLIASANPGSVVGVPEHGGPGAIAMSPKGGQEPGLGGSGGGSGIGHGPGTGSGTHGTGPGAAAKGSGLGAGAVNPGNTMGPGPGGSGSGATGRGVPGVTIQGGRVSLPSFSTASSTPGIPSRGPGEKRNPPAITIIATSRSGGAVGMYGALKGVKVYTIYIDTQIGMAVLQYAERAKSQTDFAQDLTAPEVMNSDLPSDIPKSRVLLACVMDKSGELKNVRVLDSVRAEVSQRLVAAVQKWRFRPVLRGDEPVDVDAIVGFNIDTNDHR